MCAFLSRRKSSVSHGSALYNSFLLSLLLAKVWMGLFKSSNEFIKLTSILFDDILDFLEAIFKAIKA